nr:hypothetical protein [Tanacetum cinerariifolium]
MILDPLHAVIQRVSVLKKDVQELKEADNTTTLRTSLISEIPSAVKNALEKTPLPVAQSSLKAAESLFEYEVKTILFDKMDKSRSYLAHDKHQVLDDALLDSMILDDAVAS